MQRSNLATFSSNDFNLLRPENFCVEPATARNGSCAGPTVKLDRLNERYRGYCRCDGLTGLSWDDGVPFVVVHQLYNRAQLELELRLEAAASH